MEQKSRSKCLPWHAPRTSHLLVQHATDRAQRTPTSSSSFISSSLLVPLPLLVPLSILVPLPILVPIPILVPLPFLFPLPLLAPLSFFIFTSCFSSISSFSTTSSFSHTCSFSFLLFSLSVSSSLSVHEPFSLSLSIRLCTCLYFCFYVSVHPYIMSPSRRPPLRAYLANKISMLSPNQSHVWGPLCVVRCLWPDACFPMRLGRAITGHPLRPSIHQNVHGQAIRSINQTSKLIRSFV